MQGVWRSWGHWLRREALRWAQAAGRTCRAWGQEQAVQGMESRA